MARLTTDLPVGKADRKSGLTPRKGKSGSRPVAEHQAQNVLAASMAAKDAALAERVDRLRAHVRQTGLDQGELQQVGARLPASLVRQAKKRTGLSSNTDLLTVALANLAVEDTFADAFEAAYGKIDPELDIGF